MKINVVSNGILIGAKAKDYVTQSGGKGKSYSLALEHNDEVGNVKCTDKVYDAVCAGCFPKYGNVKIYAVYDTDYKNMVVDELVLVDKK